MIIRFGEFELDDRAFELRRGGRTIHVERRVLDLIRYLAVNAHRVVPKAELLSEIWTGRRVTEASLSVAMAAARRALADDPMAQRVIRTCHGHGYQLVPPCDAGGGGAVDPDREAGCGAEREAQGHASGDAVGRAAGDADSEHTAKHAGPPGGHPHETDPSVSPLVGREREINEFTRAASRLIQGQSTLLLVSGEPGIGKTRLLDEFFRLADPLGCTTCIGRCAESGDAPELWPWYQVFRALCEMRRTARTRGMASLVAPDATANVAHGVALDVPPHVPPKVPPRDGARQLDPRPLDTRQLEGIVRELSPEHGPLESPLVSPEAARFQLYERMLDALTCLAANEKLVVALDDLHRADTSTLRFLRFAVRQTRGASILFVATHRVGELRNAPDHARVLAELTREPHAVRLQIEGLAPRETGHLFQQLCSEPSCLRAASELHHQTGGNPFFIRQLAALLNSNGAPSTPRALPPTLRDAILEQIAGLSQPARALLEAAAVVGRECSVSTLTDVVELDGVRFDAALDELLDALVMRQSGEPDRLSFAHILVRDAIFEQLGMTERRALHERIARSLSTRHSMRSEARAAEAAYHLFEAQTAESISQARRLSEAAAEAAILRSAHDDAARHYARALDALRLTDGSNDEERYRLLLALGTEQCRAGGRSAAKETFADAARLARSLDAAEKLARTALCVAPGFLAAEAGVSDPFLERLLTESLARVDSSNLALRAQLAARLAMTLHWSDAPARMREAIALAREISERLDDPVTRLHVLVARWFCEWHHDGFDERALLADEIQGYAERLRDREMILMGMMLRQVGMLERGETAAFDASLESFAGLASDLGQPQSLWYTPLYRAMRALMDGRIDRAVQRQAELENVVARVENANGFLSLITQSTLLRREMGNIETMIPELVEGAQRYPKIRAFRAGLAFSYCALGRVSETEREFEIMARGGFFDVPERFDWVAEVATAGHVCCDLGDARRASRLYELLRSCHRRFLIVGLGVFNFGSSDQLLGRLAERVGRRKEAEMHFRVAIEQNSAAGAHAWLAHTKLDYAILLARSETSARRDFWVRLASEALKAAVGMGMVSLRERAEAFLQTGRACVDDQENV